MRLGFSGIYGGPTDHGGRHDDVRRVSGLIPFVQILNPCRYVSDVPS